jgi:hypothetical protein
MVAEMREQDFMEGMATQEEEEEEVIGAVVAVVVPLVGFILVAGAVQVITNREL